VEELLASNLAITGVVAGVSLLAVWVPFYRGIVVCLHAVGATRRVRGQELAAGTPRRRRGIEPLALLFVHTLRDSQRDAGAAGMSREFVLDASKQYVLNEYETNYARLISMYANLLPPIGFIGTTAGLLLLLLSMHLSNETLELGALAAALTSSIFALMGFAALESAKIRLYGRLLRCLDEALGAVRLAEPAADRRAAVPARG
jgi:hypothetical protein